MSLMMIMMIVIGSAADSCGFCGSWKKRKNVSMGGPKFPRKPARDCCSREQSDWLRLIAFNDWIPDVSIQYFGR